MTATNPNLRHILQMMQNAEMRERKCWREDKTTLWDQMKRTLHSTDRLLRSVLSWDHWNCHRKQVGFQVQDWSLYQIQSSGFIVSFRQQHMLLAIASLSQSLQGRSLDIIDRYAYDKTVTNESESAWYCWGNILCCIQQSRSNGEHITLMLVGLPAWRKQK